MKIKKAIITAAGRGTRFLPVSKAYQKEMIPIMNKPQMQVILEELIDSGIEEVAIVVRTGVTTIVDYLQDDNELWKFLKETGKEHTMDSWVVLKNKLDITIFEQKESDPYGNGTPFILAKDWTNGEAVVGGFGDDIYVQYDKTKPTCIQQLANYYEKYNPVAVMAVKEVSREEIVHYASYDYYSENESDIPYHAKRVIEKPTPEEIASLYSNTARFILGPEVFDELSNRIAGKGGEIWLTDGVNRLMEKNQVVIAAPWEGSEWMSCGAPLRWLKANIGVVLRSGDYEEEKKDLLKFMKESLDIE